MLRWFIIANLSNRTFKFWITRVFSRPTCISNPRLQSLWLQEQFFGLKGDDCSQFPLRARAWLWGPLTWMSWNEKLKKIILNTMTGEWFRTWRIRSRMFSTGMHIGFHSMGLGRQTKLNRKLQAASRVTSNTQVKLKRHLIMLYSVLSNPFKHGPVALTSITLCKWVVTVQMLIWSTVRLILSRHKEQVFTV